MDESRRIEARLASHAPEQWRDPEPAEGARNVFETWARSAGLLLPNGDSRVATGTMPAEDDVVSG